MKANIQRKWYESQEKMCSRELKKRGKRKVKEENNKEKTKIVITIEKPKKTLIKAKKENIQGKWPKSQEKICSREVKKREQNKIEINKRELIKVKVIITQI